MAKYKNGLLLLSVLGLVLVAQSMDYYDEVEKGDQSCMSKAYVADNQWECINENNGEVIALGVKINSMMKEIDSND